MKKTLVFIYNSWIIDVSLMNIGIASDSFVNA